MEPMRGADSGVQGSSPGYDGITSGQAHPSDHAPLLGTRPSLPKEILSAGLRLGVIPETSGTAEGGKDVGYTLWNQ